jgi:hypothetical protein
MWFMSYCYLPWLISYCYPPLEVSSRYLSIEHAQIRNKFIQNLATFPICLKAMSEPTNILFRHHRLCYYPLSSLIGQKPIPRSVPSLTHSTDYSISSRLVYSSIRIIFLRSILILFSHLCLLISNVYFLL